LNLDISSIIPGIAFLLYISFTVFGLHHGKVERVRWSFILYMLSLTVWSFGSFMMHANTVVLTTLFWNRFMVTGMFAGPITIYNAMLDLSETKSMRYSVFKYLGYCLYGFLLYLNFTGNIVSDARFINNEFTYTLAQGSWAAYLLIYSYLILCIFLLVRELNRTDSKEIKKKLLLPLYGVSIMLFGILGNLYEPIGRYPIDLFAVTVNAFLIFWAIYKYQLVYYSAVVLRYILYFILILISAFIFYGLLWGLIREIRTIPFALTFSVSLLLGTASAFIYQQVKQGTLSIIERLFMGKRIDYIESLSAFSESISSIVDLYILGDLTIKKILETFNLDWAFMVIRDYSSRNYRVLSAAGAGFENYSQGSIGLPAGSKLVALFSDVSSIAESKNRFQESITIPKGGKKIVLQPSLLLPLVFKERINGCIILGPRKEKDYYNQFELDTLHLLSGQCSISMENSISFERLRRQQKRLQDLNDELTISRNKLEAFFDGITSPISIQDINYNIIMVNLAATRYFRNTFDGLIGKKCYQVFFNRTKPCTECRALDCLHTQLPFGSELKDEDSNINFAVSFYPISVPHGSDKIFLEMFQDITEQKRLQKELMQSEKLAGIGTMASGIAHEINNPLSGIIGTAEIMLDEIEQGSRLQEYTKDIIAYSQNAAEVIKELNNYSRNEKGETVNVDIIEVLKTSMKLARRGMDFKGIEVLEYYEDLPEIEANPNELQQVFLNLIINAVQSMPDKGVLTIETREKDLNAVISIKDTGSGIEEKNIEKIFTPFYTTKEPGKGTGLGLSITHQIVYNMGGRIRIDSIVGKGSVFSVSLPLTEEKKWKIRFINAKDVSSKEDSFFLQRKILVGEKGYREESIHRPEDDKAFHIVAYKGLQPVGTVSCFTPDIAANLPIERHFRLNGMREDKRCAEIDRLAVLKEERGTIISLGLMTLAYLYAKFYDVDRVFLDVFSDEKKHITMYSKLGFQEIGDYNAPLPVTVMMLDHKTDYEMKSQQLERFVKPFLSRLVKRIDFETREREKILSSIEDIMTSKADKLSS